ncbi:MAG: type I DNA topoisomerase [Myxococcaceae bacterium]
MAKPLVIVESPAKAKTIGQFVGNDMTVMASIGHVVDLPSSGLCVDVENDFALTYEVTKRDVMASLKEALKKASELYLATDADREGEAIAWHLKSQLKPKVPVKRMEFHEITKGAIRHAIEHPRQINEGLVEAQEARRTLDRLYGYEVSPVLWRKVRTGLSAGRVQSPSLRLIVERELERMRFRAVSYWDLTAHHPTSPGFKSEIQLVDGKRVARGKDFDQQGKPESDVLVLNEQTGKALAEGLTGKPFTVKSVEEKPGKSSPKPPFKTSTLQQEGGRKLNMSAQQVMRVAQGLYERGYITYMRTDSVNLSVTAVNAARAQVKELFGDQFLPAEPRVYASGKDAQEAHEAVRPAGEAFRTPKELEGELNSAELKLYKLIWERTVACQMVDAQHLSVAARLTATAANGQQVEFSANGRTLTFAGYLRAYVEGSDDPDAELEDRETPLPKLVEGSEVPVDKVEAIGHATSPPARYTEASLVKKLEDLGIGRPSTYASIIGTLQAKYVWKKGTALIPTWVAFAVVALMEKYFGHLVDYEFTKAMEHELDLIEEGKEEKVPYLKTFYFGDKKHGEVGLHQLVVENIEQVDAAAVNEIEIGKDPSSGERIVVKPGRYGPYLKRGEETASVPERISPDEMTIAKAVELLAAPKGDKPIGVDPVSGKNVYAKSGRFGAYVQLGEMPEIPKKKKGLPPPQIEKPKTASLLSYMKLDTLTLEDALKLLSLPRTVGQADGEDVVVANGRFGPYLRKGKDTRNLGIDNEAKLFTLTMDEAKLILAQPKQFRGRAAPKPPLRTFGNDPVSGKQIVMKEGRFGFYVTDGETNASLRPGDDHETLLPERAEELLQLRREYVANEGGGKRGKKAPKAAKAAAPAAETNGKAKVAKEKPAPKPPKAAKPAKPAKPAKAAKAPAKAAPKAKKKPAPKRK